MKILFIVDYYYPYIGGAETLYQKLAEGLASHHDVVVLTQQHGRKLPLEETVNGVHIYRVNTYHRALFPYQAFAIAKRLVAKADLVQAATYSAGILASHLRRHTKIKVFLIVHEYLCKRWLSLGLGGAIAYSYEKYLFHHKFDHYIGVSQSTMKELLAANILPSKLSFIYNGIDYTHFAPRVCNQELRLSLGIKPQDLLYLFSGRLGITKGVMLLLQAWQKWHRPDHAKLLLILGQADALEREKVSVFIQINNLQQSVQIIDSVPYAQLPDYIALANIVVVPSLTEGFGFFAAEVCAMHIPIIVTPVDALPEVVSGQVIVSANVTIESMRDALQQACEQKFTTLPSKTFSWSDTVAEYERLYSRSLV